MPTARRVGTTTSSSCRAYRGAALVDASSWVHPDSEAALEKVESPDVKARYWLPLPCAAFVQRSAHDDLDDRDDRSTWCHSSPRSSGIAEPSEN